MAKAVFIVFGALGVTLIAMTFWGAYNRPTGVSDTVAVNGSGAGDGEVSGERQELEIVTLLGFDAIPAILNPSFVGADEAEDWMEPNERVLGLSINGDNRAYSVRMLSRHEIVNDVVGGEPVAVTW